MKKTLYILLFPFSFIYGLLLYIRNLFFDIRILPSTKFDFPIIAVGNLNIGGVGKTPHVEYLIRLLMNNFKVCTLSRGYKRKTTGFILANTKSTIMDIGDEPLQYKKKFNSIYVAVDEKRVRGIQSIKNTHPETNIVIMDDAYQHRYVTPGINILITDFNNLYINDTVLPAGRLREWTSGSKRADIIIVSKSPKNLSSKDRTKTIQNLNPKLHQKIYFSYIKYGGIIAKNSFAKNLKFEIDNTTSILLITAIANAKPLLIELNSQFKNIIHLSYKDHHIFNKNNITDIKTSFNKIPNNKIILTTEKDSMRLSLPDISKELKDIPIFYIPIEICFHHDDKQKLNNQILKYVTEHTKN